MCFVQLFGTERLKYGRFDSIVVIGSQWCCVVSREMYCNILRWWWWRLLVLLFCTADNLHRCFKGWMCVMYCWRLCFRWVLFGPWGLFFILLCFAVSFRDCTMKCKLRYERGEWFWSMQCCCPSSWQHSLLLKLLSFVYFSVCKNTNVSLSPCDSCDSPSLSMSASLAISIDIYLSVPLLTPPSPSPFIYICLCHSLRVCICVFFCPLSLCLRS